jgi:mannose-6-phosphate isomerase-like protein (cupin superfamily)
MIVRLSDCSEFRAGDDTRLREMLHPAKADLAIGYSLAHATIDPGTESYPHRLKSSEVYFILEGQGLMHIDEDSYMVGAGDTVYIPPMARQFIRNVGEMELKFVCIVDPAWRLEDEERML